MNYERYIMLLSHNIVVKDESNPAFIVQKNGELSVGFDFLNFLKIINHLLSFSEKVGD